MADIERSRAFTGTGGAAVRHDGLPFDRTPGKMEQRDAAENWRMEVGRARGVAGDDGRDFVGRSEARLQRIAFLKEAIAAGRYRVSSEKLAMKLLNVMADEGRRRHEG